MAAHVPAVTQLASGVQTGMYVSAAGVPSLALSTSVAVPAGDSILVAVKSYPSLPTAVTDGVNTYTKIATFTDTGLGGGITLWLASSVAARPSGSTITVAGSGMYTLAAYAFDVAGLATSGVVLNSANANHNPSANANLDSGNAAATQPNVLVLALGEWMTYNTSSAVPGASEYALSATGGYVAASPARLESQNWFTFGSPTGYDGFYDRFALSTLVLSAASGNYHAVLGPVSGGPADRQAAVIILAGMPNAAPNAPALTAHGDYDPALSTTFNWTFSDPDAGDTQSAYQLQIIRASDSVVIVDSGKVTSATASRTVAGGTLTNGTAYQWKVRTWDNSDLVGAYSTLGSFNAAVPPVAAVTAPPAGGSATSNQPAVTWTYTGSTGEGAYRVRLLQAGVQVYDTGKVAGTALSHTPTYVLTNGVAYTAEVTVWDSLDIQGTPATSAFTASFTSPVTPTLSGTADADGGAIRLNVNTRGPNSAQAATTTFDILRKRTTDSAYTRIKAGLAAAPSRNATLSATVITDSVPGTIRRDQGIGGDGQTVPDSSIGVWPAATNLFLRSNALNTSPNVAGGPTITENGTTDPYGGNTGNLLTMPTGNATPLQAVTVAASTQYTFSFYARKGTIANAYYAVYDLTHGAYIVGQTAYNGLLNTSTYTLISVTFTTPAGCTSINCYVQIDGAAVAGQTLHLWEAQLEPGPIATPRAHTTTTTATRAAGRASVPSSVVTAQQGWLAFRFRAGFPSSTSYVPMLGSWNDGTYDNRIDVEFGTPSFLINRTGGGVAGNAYTAAQSFAAGSDHTVCVAYTATVITIEIDGAAFVTPVAQSAIPTGLPATLEVGSQANHSAGNEAASAFYWVAFGTGTLTDANAAALHAYGNAAPTADQINAAMPAAVCTGVLRGSDGTIDTTVASYVDYCPRSGTPYQYEARAIAASTGGTADSAALSETATITEGIWLHCPADPAGTAHHFLYDRGSRGDADQNNATFMQYAGRQFPVAQVAATAETGSVSVDLELPMALAVPHGCPDLDALRAIYNRRDTVCYRDHRGRKVFGFIPSLQIADELLKYTTTLAVTRTDFSEVV